MPCSDALDCLINLIGILKKISAIIGTDSTIKEVK
jgi:hypothetical protein